MRGLMRRTKPVQTVCRIPPRRQAKNAPACFLPATAPTMWRPREHWRLARGGFRRVREAVRRNASGTLARG